MTKELETQFKKVGSQEKIEDPIVLAHFFNPTGAGDWLVTEFDPENRIIFCYGHILEGEWGYTSLDELEEFKGPMGLGIERDLYWVQKPFSQCKHKI